MKVFLTRHAHAVDESAHLVDEHRYLNAEGRQVARAVGRRLREEGVAIDLILTSPLVRAVQTAELLADTFEYTGVVESANALSPGVPPRVAAQELGARALGAVLVVGHEPGISALGAFFTSRPSFPPFRKGQVCLIDGGQPVWSMHPQTLVIERLLLP